MTQGTFSRILSRYGRDVTVYTQDAPEGIRTRAFFQPRRDEGTRQTVPSALGQVKQDQFVYLGPADIRLDDTCKVKVEGEIFRMRAAQPVYVGEMLNHWWAVFTRRTREVME